MENLEVGELFGTHRGFSVFIGARYLGGHIGDDESKGCWIKKRTNKWERDIHAVTKTAEKHTQESYAAADRATQLEWIFLQLVPKYTGQAFALMEEFLQENVCLFVSLEDQKPSLQL